MITTAARRITRELNAASPKLLIAFDQHGVIIGLVKCDQKPLPREKYRLAGRRDNRVTQKEIQNMIDNMI